MATFNFELNHKQGKKGTYAIILRITENRKHKRIKTAVELKSPKHWNPKNQEVRKNEPNFKAMNQVLKKMKDDALQAEALLEEKGKEISAQNVASTMKAGKRVFSFIEFAETYSARTLEAGNYRTYTKYVTFLNKLKFFINGVKSDDVLLIPSKGKKYEKFLEGLKKDLLFNEITLAFLNQFKAYLKKIPNAKKPGFALHQNTISKQFDVFKSLYHKGIIELKEGGLLVKENPFENFECETIDTNKEKLTWDEIEALRALDLEEGTFLWHTRNCFMLAFYCAGMRTGDLIQLRGTNVVYENGDWRIRYRMDKTTTAKEILLLPEALEIISKYVDIQNRTTDYIFPILNNKALFAKAVTWESKEQLPYEIKNNLLKQISSKNCMLNTTLKKLAAMAGIEKRVTMHTARHSFANIARQKKANVYDISKVLGHSSLKITETYLSKFDTTTQDATMKQVFQNNDKVNEDILLKQLQSLNPEILSSLLEKINANNTNL